MDNQKLRIAVYNYRDFDEAQFFTKFAGTYNAEYVIIRESPSPENARLAEGCQGVTVITTATTEEIIRIWEGGLAVYGGLIAGVLVIFLTAKIKKFS